MGVRSLWKILEPCAKKAELENKTLAVDTSIWMHRYKSIPDNVVIFSIAKRIFRILYNKVRPVFIFDGKPPAAKRETVEKRKQAELKSLIRKIVLNKTCGKCGEPLKVCRHINDFDALELKKLNEEATSKLKNHSYNWGEHSDEADDVVGEDKHEAGVDGEHVYVDFSISGFDYESIQGLSKQQQLERLIELRSKRKFPMAVDNSDFSSFCKSQLENVKKRNKITSLIRSLNANARKTIQSDWTGYAEFKKDEMNIFKAFYYKEDAAQPSSAKERSESSDIECLFEELQKDEWDGVFERYRAPSLKSSKDEAEKQTSFNLLLLKAVNDDNSTASPSCRIVHEEQVEGCSLPSTDEDASSQSQKLSATEEDSCEASVDAFDCLGESSDNSYCVLERKSSKPDNSMECGLEISSNDLQRIQRLIVELLNILELPYIESIGEADAQCRYLFKNGLVDGVISEDNDMIIHGITVYKNFFRKDKDVLSCSYQDVAECLNLDQTALIKLSYLLGSDYCPGVRGVGIKSALGRVKDVSASEISFLEAIYNDENVKMVDKVHFGSLNKNKLRNYLLARGFDQPKIDELVLYCRKVVESCNLEY